MPDKAEAGTQDKCQAGLKLNRWCLLRLSPRFSLIRQVPAVERVQRMQLIIIYCKCQWVLWLLLQTTCVEGLHCLTSFPSWLLHMASGSQLFCLPLPCFLWETPLNWSQHDLRAFAAQRNPHSLFIYTLTAATEAEQTEHLQTHSLISADHCNTQNV